MESSPFAISVHCYGHFRNLAIHDTMADTKSYCNLLGTILESTDLFSSCYWTSPPSVFADSSKLDNIARRC
ncbi:Hypothetical predicted protein [Octopus vulgaris]|uniref:Uncharacterized protein n=1 Tax=Octopus vulgaris TaxID=6645 RepID=A0AA36BB61_OCTVU|nr:Hypothetical predicted protein [Octopus vulgaris]